MKDIEDYCNEIIYKMGEYYKDTENKDMIAKLYKEVYGLYVFGELPDAYFNKISHAFKEMRTTRR